ncbi:cornifelin homolog [Anneissia japonica]|uniref:cornifelin homolog n=1 Tax=Anneissia japonica TaxID=1529436 RepID=UPI001425B131|nr:cornifelin homolog [Anneissia japonica]
MINGLFISQMESAGMGHYSWNSTFDSNTSSVVLQQPKKNSHTRLEEEGQWKTSLIGCCEDMESFLLSVFCPFCVSCDIANQIGENPCIAIVPGGLLALRTRIRTKKNIKGSLCEDCMVQCCFCQLSIGQMYREVNTDKTKGPSGGWTMV